MIVVCFVSLAWLAETGNKADKATEKTEAVRENDKAEKQDDNRKNDTHRPPHVGVRVPDPLGGDGPQQFGTSSRGCT